MVFSAPFAGNQNNIPSSHHLWNQKVWQTEPLRIGKMCIDPRPHWSKAIGLWMRVSAELAKPFLPTVPTIYHLSAWLTRYILTSNSGSVLNTPMNKTLHFNHFNQFTDDMLLLKHCLFVCKANNNSHFLYLTKKKSR